MFIDKKKNTPILGIVKKPYMERRRKYGKQKDNKTRFYAVGS